MALQDDLYNRAQDAEDTATNPQETPVPNTAQPDAPVQPADTTQAGSYGYAGTSTPYSIEQRLADIDAGEKEAADAINRRYDILREQLQKQNNPIDALLETHKQTRRQNADPKTMTARRHLAALYDTIQILGSWFGGVRGGAPTPQLTSAAAREGKLGERLQKVQEQYDNDYITRLRQLEAQKVQFDDNMRARLEALDQERGNQLADISNKANARRDKAYSDARQWQQFWYKESAADRRHKENLAERQKDRTYRYYYGGSRGKNETETFKAFNRDWYIPKQDLNAVYAQINAIKQRLSKAVEKAGGNIPNYADDVYNQENYVGNKNQTMMLVADVLANADTLYNQYPELRQAAQQAKNDMLELLYDYGSRNIRYRSDSQSDNTTPPQSNIHDESEIDQDIYNTEN